MGLTRVELENFTAFRSLKLDLSPGVNVLVGANGTGKTHLMKVVLRGVRCSVGGGFRTESWWASSCHQRRNLWGVSSGAQQGAAGKATIRM